ncbi:hypothetical protein GJ744_012185 [Endocarpon pusillum]|uniref:MHD domain-containing protein n=1 Tax=Endocarpon pusillum TaxID=364733 RepID=A0A8H7AFF3_9EURO|nr:hypothetical protein GJ744_012185 [Endocarpon pusillum]
MDSSRQEYPALLSVLEPSQAVNVLNDRVEVISKTNDDIADWLLERRKVEETYAQGLRKLARRPQSSGGASLGIFQLPWQRIVESTESLAQSHESLAQKIEVDAETPLRQFASKNREMQAMSTVRGNLTSIAKDFENAQKKADKLKDTSGRLSSARASNTNSSVDDAKQQWETQAAYVFEQLQSLDEVRVNHLRDVLTQFQTHEVDSIEQNRKPAELCLNDLLNIETADEIKTFAIRISTNPPRAPHSRRQSSASSTLRRLSSAGGGAPPMPPPPRLTDDRTRPIPTFSDETGQGGFTPEIKKTPKKQGLKSRLGTVMGRRKNVAPAPIPSAEKPKKERNRSSLMPFRRGDSSRSQPDSEAVSVTSRNMAPPISEETTRPTSSMRRPETANRPSTRSENVRQEQTYMGSALVNGTSSAKNHADITGTNASVNQATTTNTVTLNQPLHELSVTPPSPVQHMDVVSRAQQEAAATNAENEEAVRRLKIRDQPIQEDEIEAQQAMDNMANQLRLQAQSSGINRLGGSMRGRRDVRNTIFVPNPEPRLSENEISPGSEAGLASATAVNAAETVTVGTAASSYADSTTASPIKAPALLPEERNMSDTTSVHSAQSLGTLVHHPEMHEPGLNSSIVETVSTWFSDGTVNKSFVVGEVALAYNSSESTSDTELIRLDNFQVLEKIAPNPGFVSAAASEKGKEKAVSEEGAGQYSVMLSAIKRPTPVVAFKYQLHLDPSNPSVYSPVLITPAWQIQDTQVSVIVMYTLNPAFVLSANKTQSSTISITLKNVTLSITLDPSADAGKATSAMMAPQIGAAFKRKQGLVVWKLPELVVSSEQQKLLARFVTTGSKARPGHIEARWELPGTTGSRLGVSLLAGAEKSREFTADPFADDGTAPASPAQVWKEVHTARSLVSGRYSAS